MHYLELKVSKCRKTLDEFYQRYAEEKLWPEEVQDEWESIMENLSASVNAHGKCFCPIASIIAEAYFY
jgi:hypothetical protein